MEAAVWMCLILLCLQGSLLQLTHGADCSRTSDGEDCVPTRGGMNDVPIRLRQSPKKNRVLTKPQRERIGGYSPIGMSVDDDNTPSEMPLDRQKRQLGKHSILPGSISAKGFPNTLIQKDKRRWAEKEIDRARSKKKNKHKSRAGSFSLISHDKPSASLQVTRVRRQLKNNKKKGGARERPGAYTILGDPEEPTPLGQRLQRSAQKKKQTKRLVCS
ncbi:hypothetical protein UPYG_G00077640 [Umbra pygmaea]|uniref:Uncharacterized protein n=1 Tax=Umbra pygmaea TaxID=75934 RepID=A0ABD0XD21_UMBPY